MHNPDRGQPKEEPDEQKKQLQEQIDKMLREIEEQGGPDTPLNPKNPEGKPQETVQ